MSKISPKKIVDGVQHKIRQIKVEVSKVAEYFKPKFGRLRVKLQLRSANRKFRSRKFLSAYHILIIASSNAKIFKMRKQFMEIIQERIKQTLNQIDRKIQKDTTVLRRNLSEQLEKRQFSVVIDKCTSFFTSLQNYPQTDITEKCKALIRKEFDIATKLFWEGVYKEDFAKIVNLKKRRNFGLAINIGREFLKKTQNVSLVPGIKIYRDRIFDLIQDPIAQKWLGKYKTIKNYTTKIRTHRQFEQAVMQSEKFLKYSLKDQDVVAVHQLRLKTTKKVERLQTDLIFFGRKDNYDNFVTRAMINYELGCYERAIKYIDKAIKLLKLYQLEEQEVLIKNTKIFVKNVQFKFLCQDKIREREIRVMIDTARKLYYDEKESKAISVLLEAQGQFNMFSTLYKDLENKAYKKLFREIRNGINKERIKVSEISL